MPHVSLTFVKVAAHAADGVDHLAVNPRQATVRASRDHQSSRCSRCGRGGRRRHDGYNLCGGQLSPSPLCDEPLTASGTEIHRPPTRACPATHRPADYRCTSPDHPSCRQLNVQGQERAPARAAASGHGAARHQAVATPPAPPTLAFGACPPIGSHPVADTTNTGARDGGGGRSMLMHPPRQIRQVVVGHHSLAGPVAPGLRPPRAAGPAGARPGRQPRGPR